jgi:hypothetical protein
VQALASVTPWLMSGDWRSSVTITAHVSPLMPNCVVGVADALDRVARDLRVVDPRVRRDLARDDAQPVVTSVSQATRLVGSCARIASRMASEIWSATLSGWPIETDSEVKSWRDMAS